MLKYEAIFRLTAAEHRVSNSKYSRLHNGA